MKRGGEYLCVFEDRAIQHYRSRRSIEFLMQPKFIAQEIQLGMKRPALHIVVEIRQVGIVFVWLVKRFDAVGAAQELDQRRFARTHVACNRN